MAFKIIDTKFGFEWGPINVTRIADHGRFGVWVRIETGKESLEIRSTPKGSLRIEKTRKKVKA